MQEYESTGELLVDLGSDQTSLHNPFNGGYYPVQVSVCVCCISLLFFAYLCFFHGFPQKIF